MPKVEVKMISCHVETYKCYEYEMLVKGVKYTLTTNNIDWKHIWYKGEPLDENYIDDKSYIVSYEDNYQNIAFCEVIDGEWTQYIDVKETTEIERLTEIFLKAKKK